MKTQASLIGGIVAVFGWLSIGLSTAQAAVVLPVQLDANGKAVGETHASSLGEGYLVSPPPSTSNS